MKGDFSRFSYDPSKHYVGVFMQQGRAQLDSDWNENIENFLYLLQRTSRDLLGRPACVGDSFRIGRDIPIDHMLNPNAWEPMDVAIMQKQYYIFLNSYDRPRAETRASHEKGSLFVQKTKGIKRDFKRLDLSNFRTICLKFKPVEDEDKISDKHVKLYLTIRAGRRETTYEWSEKFGGSRDAGGFYTIEYDLTMKSDKNKPINNDPYYLSNISTLAIRWNFDGPVSIGVISGEPFATIIGLKPAEMFLWENSSEARYSLSTIGRGKKEDDDYHTKPVLSKAPGVTAMQWKSQVPVNLGLFKALHFQATKDLKEAKLAIKKPGGKMMHVIPIIKKKSESSDNDSFWHYYTADLRMHPKSHVRTVTDSSSSNNNSLLEVESLEILNLPKDELLFSEFLGELDLQNNIIISSDLELGGLSRMYVNGILCESEHWQTYLTQRDYPMPADHSALSSLRPGASNGKNETTSYMVFTDVWQRGITHIEDPALLEVALGGPDTSTRLETVCQIKLRELPTGLDFEGQLKFAEGEISKMKGLQLGRLSTLMRDSIPSLRDSSSLDYPDLDNRLYRIQIHDAGDKIRELATFKWSKDNGSTRFHVLQVSEFSVEIRSSSKATGSNNNNNNSIGIGDLIEIVDDADELYQHSRGELRRITNVEVDVDRNTIILHWSASQEGEEQQHNIEDYPHLYDPITRRYFPEYHPKIIRWDGISRVSGEEHDDDDGGLIPLYDEKYSKGDASIAVRFEQGIFQTGDYWNFTTRTANGVENLKSVPPNGVNHEFTLLALIKKEPSKIEVTDDLRHEFRPLWDLRAIDIAYDGVMPDGSVASNLHSAIQFLSGNVQNFQRHAIEQQPYVQIRPGSDSPKAKGYGTIANLCVQAGDDELAGRDSKQIFFEYSYDHQPLLLYNVTNQNGAPVRCRINDLRTGKANPKYEGFSVTAEENSQLSWISIGSSHDYIEGLVEDVIERLSKKHGRTGMEGVESGRH